MGEGKRLTAVLVTGYLCHNLCGNVTGSEEAVWLLNHGFTDNSTVLEHIFQIQQVAVMLSLGKIIGVMKVDNSLFMSFYNIFRKKYTPGQVFADFSSHIISLGRVDHRVFVRILLLHFFVHMVNQSQNPVVSGIALAGKLALITVAHILLRNFIAAHLHNSGLYHILNIFHIDSMCHTVDLL